MSAQKSFSGRSLPYQSLCKNSRSFIVYARGMQALSMRGLSHPTPLHNLGSGSLSSSPSSTREFSSAPTGSKGDDPLPAANATCKAAIVTNKFSNSSIALNLHQGKITAESLFPPHNPKANLLASHDPFALPGDMGVPSNPRQVPPAKREAPVQVLSPLEEVMTPSDVINEKGTNYEKQVETLSNLENYRSEDILRGAFPLEYKVQECPKLMVKDMQQLFPDENLEASLTAITLSQKTENDMSSWSEDVEEERETLMEQFVDAAQNICSHLRDQGYWADFIDPSSGSPYYGPHVNDTLFETDERYRHLGFVIEDLGCCKVLFHKKFGTNVFVGAIFTDSPPDSQGMLNLLESFKPGTVMKSDPDQEFDRLYDIVISASQTEADLGILDDDNDEGATKK